MEASSTETGEFWIDGLTESARVDVHVNAPGFVATVIESVTPERPGPVEVVLQRGAVIEGSVRAGGRPAAEPVAGCGTDVGRGCPNPPRFKDHGPRRGLRFG